MTPGPYRPQVYHYLEKLDGLRLASLDRARPIARVAGTAWASDPEVVSSIRSFVRRAESHQWGDGSLTTQDAALETWIGTLPAPVRARAARAISSWSGPYMDWGDPLPRRHWLAVWRWLYPWPRPADHARSRSRAAVILARRIPWSAWSGWLDRIGEPSSAWDRSCASEDLRSLALAHIGRYQLVLARREIAALDLPAAELAALHEAIPAGGIEAVLRDLDYRP
jgi:hypothetical protein